ncbi:hypothetical protein BDV09DRAFT_18499 [Aspergillus tetrazonus]
MKWKKIERIEENSGDGMGSKIKKVQEEHRPVQMQVGGYVKGPGALDPLHWTYGVGVVLLLLMLSFFPGLQCLTR